MTALHAETTKVGCYLKLEPMKTFFPLFPSFGQHFRQKYNLWSTYQPIPMHQLHAYRTFTNLQSKKIGEPREGGVICWAHLRISQLYDPSNILESWQAWVKPFHFVFPGSWHNRWSVSQSTTDFCFTSIPTGERVIIMGIVQPRVE